MTTFSLQNYGGKSKLTSRIQVFIVPKYISNGRFRKTDVFWTILTRGHALLIARKHILEG